MVESEDDVAEIIPFKTLNDSTITVKRTAKLLGQGAFGKVYLGYEIINSSTDKGQHYAIKIIDKTKLKHKMKSLLYVENKILSEIKSDHVIKLYG